MLTLSFPQNFHNHRMIQPEIRNLLSPLIKSICIFLLLSWLNNRKPQRWRHVLWLKHWTKTPEEAIQFLVLPQDFLCDLVLNLLAPLFSMCKDGYYYTLQLFYWIMSSVRTGLSIKVFRDTTPAIGRELQRGVLLSSPQTHSKAVTSHCCHHMGQAWVQGTQNGSKRTCRASQGLLCPFFPRGSSKAWACELHRAVQSGTAAGQGEVCAKARQTKSFMPNPLCHSVFQVLIPFHRAWHHTALHFLQAKLRYPLKRV